MRLLLRGKDAATGDKPASHTPRRKARPGGTPSPAAGEAETGEDLSRHLYFRPGRGYTPHIPTRTATAAAAVRTDCRGPHTGCQWGRWERTDGISRNVNGTITEDNSRQCFYNLILANHVTQPAQPWLCQEKRGGTHRRQVGALTAAPAGTASTGNSPRAAQ